MHPSEIVYLLMPPVLAGLLWWRLPSVREIKPRQVLIYVAVVTAAVSGMIVALAYLARLRLKWHEIAIVVWFVFAWRLAWAVWVPAVSWAIRSVFRIPATAATGSRATRLPLVPSLLRLVLTLVVFAPLFVGAVITHRFKFGDGIDPAAEGLGPYETVTFRTKDGLDIAGWFFSDADSDSTVVICHGAGANKGNFLPFVLLFENTGYNALIFDLRAHGDSDGHTTTYGLREALDVTAAVDWLRAERPDRARHVFGLGSSMGAVALIAAASAGASFDAIVLDSCYSSVQEMADYHLGRLGPVGRAWGRLVLGSASLQSDVMIGSFDLVSRVESLHTTPMYFIHSTEDVVIPVEQSDRVFDAATTSRKHRWHSVGPHSNIVSAEFEEYQRRVIAFFDEARGGPPAGFFRAPATRREH